MTSQIAAIVNSQHQAYLNKKYHSLETRIENLKKFKELIIKNTKLFEEALLKDLGKCKFESHVSEIDFTIAEINHFIKHLKKWASPKRVSSPLVHFPSRSYIYSEPYGKVLIISPWNYPFQLLLSPAVGAIAAGNTVVLKPSEIASETSKAIFDVFNSAFETDLLEVVEGGVQETTELLDQRFDYIFYTGNAAVARIVSEKAAKNLTPVTLELGGKSPCFVYGEVDMDVTARRVIWGKFFNAGQTCVAPDYILIDPKLKSDFVEKCKKYSKEFYGKNPLKSKDYGRIINERHFDRLSKLIDQDKVVMGGESIAEEKFIAPTIVDALLTDEIMKDEIFGPILPIIESEDISTAIDIVRKGEKPLAAYVFSADKSIRSKVVNEVSAGGMVENDVLIHLSNASLPFGGVGESGMGMYHGKFSFDLFSHKKAVMKRTFKFDVKVKYPPYFGKLNLIKTLLKYFG